MPSVPSVTFLLVMMMMIMVIFDFWIMTMNWIFRIHLWYLSLPCNRGLCLLENNIWVKMSFKIYDKPWLAAVPSPDHLHPGVMAGRGLSWQSCPERRSPCPGSWCGPGQPAHSRPWSPAQSGHWTPTVCSGESDQLRHWHRNCDGSSDCWNCWPASLLRIGR